MRLSRSLVPVPLAAILLLPGLVAFGEELDPQTLTKYIDPLPIPGAMPQAGPNYYEIGAWEIHQQLHSQLPPTYLFGYGTSQATASYPAATIEAQKGVPIDIHWTNHLGFDHPVSFAFDFTLDHAITTTGIPITTHVHGSEVEPQSDGGPETWFTAGFAEKGPDWKKEVLHYANNQLPTTLWYHDHALGYTRHNVYAGLAGFYIVRDPATEPVGLPGGPYEIPIVIQDKMFTTDGQLWYPNVGDNPEHPVWTPEFFGNVILVNGKVWPYLEVEPRKYRFRMLNGSNARFYSLALADPVTSAPGPAFYQIGSDGGYLSAPVVLNEPFNPMSRRLLLAPAERADVIIDFSAYQPGTEFLLKNTGKAPFPHGDAADPTTVGQIMKFRVVPLVGQDDSVIPTTLTTVNRLSNPVVTRTLTLNEVEGTNGPLMAMINMLHFMTEATEYPTVGTTEQWEIVNMTGDAHPIHIHLVQFQLLNRQKVKIERYEEAFEAANPDIESSQVYNPVDVTPYLRGRAIRPDENERGWKDTFRMNPGEVTRILVRFAPQDESPSFAFDATAEPGYVYHCHILEHEENDMMRPYHLVNPVVPPAAQNAGLVAGPSVTLKAPYPQPATSGATLQFSLGSSGSVSVILFDLSGRMVRRLADGFYEAGEHTLAWNGLNGSGQRVPAGIYFVIVDAAGRTATQKLVVQP